MSTKPTPSTVKCRDFFWTLLKDGTNTEIIEWINKEEGEFRIIDKEAVLAKWAEEKNLKKVSYDSLSRVIRHCYTCNLMKKGEGAFQYKFVKGTELTGVSKPTKRKATSTEEEQPAAKRTPELINNNIEVDWDEHSTDDNFVQLMMLFFVYYQEEY